MIDLHTHTFLSDGELSPFELVYTVKYNGYVAVAITDHVDYSNMELIIPGVVKAAKILMENYDILVLPGVELTYIPPKLIKYIVIECRNLGSKVVVVHGETVSETVPVGTNICAIRACVDILAHPGYLSEDEAILAAENNVKIEITTRRGHNVTNKKIAEMAISKKAKLVLNTDMHTSKQFLTKELIAKTLLNAGLSTDYYSVMRKNSLEIVNVHGYSL
ncbi:MAG: histidinol phosphate phosphatase domain-containing protein [Endomicrobium sp.]|jgi:histidinol phosphatase-like PHP family hydrolase|nr:histidinol phosphate phosphatase domain-containing protein [Endomicrobium sp.]